MWSCHMVNAVATSVAAAFGDEVLHTYAVPIKSMVDAGINVSQEGHWDELELLITRKDETGKVWGPDQRVDRETALRISTQNGANYVLKGDKLGSIEVGKLADLVVIDRDFMSMPVEDMSEIRSLLTLLGGKFIFLRTDFSDEHNLKPDGAVISTYEELRQRTPSRF
jgi:predicted amidohydrolase YtcJ